MSPSRPYQGVSLFCQGCARPVPNSAYPPTPLFWPQLHESQVNMRVAGTLLSRQPANDPLGSATCGQNNDNKGLNAAPGAVSSAAALHIFCRFCFGRKVRCHKGAVEKLRGAGRGWHCSEPRKMFSHRKKQIVPAPSVPAFLSSPHFCPRISSSPHSSRISMGSLPSVPGLFVPGLFFRFILPR